MRISTRLLLALSIGMAAKGLNAKINSINENAPERGKIIFSETFDSEDAFILDAHEIVFVWIGSRSHPAEQRLAMDTAVDYSERNSSSAAGQTYLNEDTREIGLAYLLHLILRHIPYYTVAWIAYKMNVDKQEVREVREVREVKEVKEDEEDQEVQEVPSEIRFFSRLTVYCVLVSTIFLFDLGANTLTLYIRFMMYGFIPACVVLAWAWQHRYYPRLVKLTFLFGMAGTFYALLYSFYISYLGVAE